MFLGTASTFSPIPIKNPQRPGDEAKREPYAKECAYHKPDPEG